MRILSIDFDYFIDTSIEVRNSLFPVAEEGVTSLTEWLKCYINFPFLLEIGVVKELDLFLSKKLRGDYILVSSDTHKDINKIFQQHKDEKFIIDNIDFHHDRYCLGLPSLNCSNWVEYAMSKYNVIEYNWYKRNDSETKSLTGEIQCTKHKIEEVFNNEYDYVFLCFSPEWSPIHLRSKYLKLREKLDEKSNFIK